MKKPLFLFAFLLVSQLGFSQIYADSTLLDARQAGQYLLVVPNYKKKQFSFSVQYAATKKTAKLTNASGEVLIFDTMLAGFDFFYQQGWEFSTAITDTFGFNGVVGSSTNYLFQRRK